MELQIKSLDNLLKNALQPGEQLKSYSTKNLTSAGDNYGSIMLSITLNIHNTSTKENYEKHLVGKMPLVNEFFRNIFKVDLTFKKEALIYRDVLPFFNKFYKNRTSTELDMFPKYLGGQLNYDKSTDRIHNDSIIFLEDLKIKGYKTLDRFKGFDENTAKIVIQALATLHATTIAIKLDDIWLFHKLFLSNLEYVSAFDGGIEINNMINISLKHATANPKCKAVESKIKEVLTKGLQNLNSAIKCKEPFGTFSHNDLWLNNVMVKNDGTNIKCKLLDFQLSSYDSVGKDLIFFLFTSLESTVLKNSFDDLIRYYFDEFTQTLNILNVDTRKFTWNAFLDEVKDSAISTELTHLFAMLLPIFSTPDKSESIDVLEEGTLPNEDDVSDEHKQRAVDIALIYIEKGWI
ncbi:uncharacterized protein LOC108734592 [Agrilus planipennis]|uniref:Uncharacterized protein LOC108734592 n=1 Tax=Agrilus planipennis TaxID=224129 RepID=A0A1W4WMN8_AGRPL|nr:uncharacterized protein LOC108734592 [Agrilus planipennis]